MLPSIAASRSGHWNQEGITRMAALNAVGTDAHPGQDLPRKASTSAMPSARAIRQLDGNRPCRQAVE
jgi:hypothetical protein